MFYICRKAKRVEISPLYLSRGKIDCEMRRIVEQDRSDVGGGGEALIMVTRIISANVMPMGRSWLARFMVEYECVEQRLGVGDVVEGDVTVYDEYHVELLVGCVVVMVSRHQMPDDIRYDNAMRTYVMRGSNLSVLSVHDPARVRIISVHRSLGNFGSTGFGTMNGSYLGPMIDE